jgi:uncharacterized protein YcfJ
MNINRSIAMLSIRMSRLPLVAAVLAALPAQAADYTDTARVVSATPIIERVREPRQECTTEAPQPRTPQAERSVMAPIIGGVAGALLGSTVGRGSGRDAATAAGAIAGAIVGDRVSNPDSDRSMAGSVIGGAAGGLLGAQEGQGNGRTAAAAAGAIVGAVAGDRVEIHRPADIELGRRAEHAHDGREGDRVKDILGLRHLDGRNKDLRSADRLIERNERLRLRARHAGEQYRQQQGDLADEHHGNPRRWAAPSVPAR